MKELYATAGEKVTCTNGHLIGIVTRDIFYDDVFTGDMLRDWQAGIDHSHLAVLGNCRICGAAWNGSDDATAERCILHFENGWGRRGRRPLNPLTAIRGGA